MVVAPYGSHTSREDFIVKEDKLYPSPAAVMEEQLKMLGTRQLEPPKLNGRWIYLKGKVPSTS